MTLQQLNKCLIKVYLSARRRDETFYDKKSLTAIRAAFNRHLRIPSLNKFFSIIFFSFFLIFLNLFIFISFFGYPLFTDANKTLSSYLKTLSKRDDIAPTAHKQASTKEVVKKLHDEGVVVEFDTLNPGILQQTTGFFISLFLNKRGRENQHTRKKTMLTLRKTPAGEEYYEVSNERGIVLPTKNHQGGVDDQDDESNGKTRLQELSNKTHLEISQTPKSGIQ